MLNYGRCLDGYNKTRRECTDWRDDGYEKCDVWSNDCVSWAKNCVVSWIPFIGPAICKVFEWICTAFQWICKAVVWISHWVCHAWAVVTTFVCILWETWLPVAALAGIFVKLIFSIPIIGGIIKEIVNAMTAVFFAIVGLVTEGIACGLLGICLPKKMRLCVVITHDGRQLVTSAAALQPILDRTKQIYLDEANITVHASVSIEGRVPNVEPECGVDGWVQDLGLTGSQYEQAQSFHCPEYSWASVLGLGSPIYAFAVTDIKGKNGCSLAWLSNYVVFERPEAYSCGDRTHLAHEIGHTCSLLFHAGDDDTTNLMRRECNNVPPGRSQLSRFQKVLVRGSKYVTYF